MKNTPFRMGDVVVEPGTMKDIRVKITETYAATPLFIPVTVINGLEEGPSLFVISALHGDELNGIEIARQLRLYLKPRELAGRLLLVPIANPISFLNQQRLLPDNRDLNRVFPGSPRGSLASFIANSIFEKIVKRCQFGIDIHTAGYGRTNLPHVRADMGSPHIRRLARAFGSEIIFDLPGEKGTLRYEACIRGIPTIAYEAGEPLKFQRSVIEKGVAGIKNVMVELGMIGIRPSEPSFQIVVREHKWIRAEKGGILVLNIRPGDIVYKGEEIAFNTKPFGTKINVLKAPFSGLVIGTTTIPTVIPGSAVAHIIRLGKEIDDIKKRTRILKAQMA
jgi:hypothetical protein